MVRRRKTNFEFQYYIDSEGRKIPRSLKVTTTNKYGVTWQMVFIDTNKSVHGDWTIVHGCHMKIKKVMEYAIWVTEVWGTKLLPY